MIKYGSPKDLKIYAGPAQLNIVIVLLSIPADLSHKDKVENINKIGRPEENLKIKF